MCRKIVFCVCLLVLAGLVNTASASTWTNDDPANDSWCTPGNWDTLAVQWRNGCE
ncbi:MAG: hypothetical protein ACYS76_16605 [Planctomycetota bacterium]|jgi:hypothetical protein